jgi:DNA-binding transcriptional ArsR family regulator
MREARLGVLTSLVAIRRAWCSAISKICALTDGNLGRHLAVLQEAGLIDIEKATTTTARSHLPHHTRPRRYLELSGGAGAVVRDAASAAKAGSAPLSFRRLKPV